MTLKYSEKSHRYWQDGKPIRGVTGLISGGIPKPAIPPWGYRLIAEFVADYPTEIENMRRHGRDTLVNSLRSLPNKTRDDAGVRGTEIHALAEQVIHGTEIDVPDRLWPYIDGYIKLLDDWGVQPVLTERSVANKTHWYAGRFDGVVRIPRLCDGLILWDLKTARGIYGETALQTAAYASAQHYVEDGKPDIEIPMPAVDRTIVVHITGEGSRMYGLCDSPAAIAEAFDLFLSAAKMSKATERIKAFVGDPLTINETQVA